MPETTRKTKTSSAVKDRYNKKAYDVIMVRVPKGMGEAFKHKCAELGVSQAQIIKQAVEGFLSK